MTTKDKTGDRLVASIRRTRAGTGKTSGDAPVEQTAPSRPAAGKRTGAKPAKAAASERPAPRDSYRSGGRVWPD